QFVVQAMSNIYKLIALAGKNDEIKVSTAIDFQLLDLGHFEVPSQAYFINDGVNRNYIEQICDFIVGHDSQLLANVHPFLAVNKMPSWTVDFALFNDAPIVHDQDANLDYTNLFDLLLDALYRALARIKNSYQTSLKIVVSASGWPSAGDSPYASIERAGTYYKNLIAHVPIRSPFMSQQPKQTY
ncbi:glycosyl hydrolase family 17 protein, partial [Acinetobacter indicus]|uniref:glycosyl hydrolase family 17 protein n=1 Tax=Acinetobacter indicus TaxID=756892 RepID=UPI00144417C9